MEIDGKTIKIDPSSDSAKIAGEYLSAHPDMAQAFLEQAHHDHVNGLAHFEIPHTSDHPDISHHFTLVHNGDGTYDLRRRHGY